MGFWDRVKAEVKRQNRTLEGVADDTKISKRTLYGWIAKDVLPRVDEANEIAKTLKVSVEYLVDGERPDIDVPWIKAHADLIEDLKILTPDEYRLLTKGIRETARERREQLGKSSDSVQSGS